MSSVGPPVIETVGLTKRYRDTDALVDLDLVVSPGEVVGYLGPNGAGKTTTIRLLLGLIRATSGSAGRRRSGPVSPAPRRSTCSAGSRARSTSGTGTC